MTHMPSTVQRAATVAASSPRAGSRAPTLMPTSAVVALGYTLIHWLQAGPLLPWVGFVLISPLTAALVWWRFRGQVRDAAARPTPRPALAPAWGGE